MVDLTVDRAGDVAGVLLAAGAGQRLGRPKALVEFGGVPLTERGLGTLRAGGCRPVIVVLGAAADDVRRACGLGDAVVVVNAAWSDGMGGSVRAGLAEARRCGASAVLVLAVDQPLITPALVARLIGSWREGAQAAVATYGGEMSTPVLLDRSLWPQVELHAVGDVGARAFLRRDPGVVTPVACDDVGDPSDVDTEDDLRRLEGQLATRRNIIATPGRRSGDSTPVRVWFEP
jgi:nicotine blue oxidoreductase